MVICGFHAVEESLRSGARGSLLISRSDSRVESLKDLARERAVAVRLCSAKELSRICGHDRHQGVVLFSETSGGSVKKNLQDTLSAIEGSSPLILLLDELNDPHNLGRSEQLRTADRGIEPGAGHGNMQALQVLDLWGGYGGDRRTYAALQRPGSCGDGGRTPGITAIGKSVLRFPGSCPGPRSGGFVQCLRGCRNSSL